ncbi:MAG: phage antirepressor KilAC domain-containing protein [Bacteroidaceae bacterium]|nr:phage antirepressor KilAC domain-containing protein [Bacteroidaceae bacterium]
MDAILLSYDANKIDYIMAQTNSIQVFNSPQFGQVRTAGTSDNPLFCLADLCKALDLHPNVVKQRLTKDVCSTYPLETAGGIQQANFVNEDGLYDVILDSRKPEAKQFRKWVTSEVLPSIRKTGGYSVQQLSRKELLQLALEAEEEKERLQLVNIEQEHQLKLQAPKVEYHDKVLSSEGYLTVNMIADCLGISAIKLNKLLCEWDVQYYESKTYHLKAKYRDKGYVVHRPHPYVDSQGNIKTRQQMYWTELGKQFILDLYNKKMAA